MAKKLAADLVELVELPRDLVEKRLREFLRPGQDPLLFKLTRTLLAERGLGQEKMISSVSVFFTLKMRCGFLNLHPDVADQWEAVIVDSMETINHPDARRFAEAIRRQGFAKQPKTSFGRRSR